MEAYEDMIRHTATKTAPWYVVPADNKWFTRLVVAAAIIDRLDSLDLQYPKVGKEKLKELAAAKASLMGGWQGKRKGNRNGETPRGAPDKEVRVDRRR